MRELMEIRGMINALAFTEKQSGRAEALVHLLGILDKYIDEHKERL